MLTKLTIKNFKRFKAEAVLELGAITALVGANNSGKSTLLQALSILQYCVDVTRKKKNGNGLTLENITIGPEEFGALPVTSPTDLWPDGKTNKPISIKAEYDNGATIAFEIKLSFNRFSVAPTIHGDVSKIVSEGGIRYVPIHSGIALREGYMLAPERSALLRGLQHGSVIRNLLWDLKENDKPRWKLLLEILQRLYPNANIDVNFDKAVDRFIAAEYSDANLMKQLDVVVSGTGFQQVLQILSGILSGGSRMVLLDEPDAHLHARLQGELMRVFEELAEKQGIQFVFATHSPHLLAASPAGALRAVIDGHVNAFATTPEQMDVLDTLGAFDRMEIIPLLRTKAVVFVENRDDRDYLEMFARNVWGEVKTKKIWEGLSFLFTYQEPLAADVKRLARQVKDLLSAKSIGDLAGGNDAKFLVIGDRDYRSTSTVAELKKTVTKAAKGDNFKLDLKCVIWDRNEIENYLIDPAAIAAAALASMKEPTSAEKERVKQAVADAITSGLASLRDDARVRIAHQLQVSDPECRNNYTRATKESNKILDDEWGDGYSLCDAKRLLSHIRSELQKAKVKAAVKEDAVIAAMKAVPADVEAVLKLLQRHSATVLRKTKAAGVVKAAKPADGGQ